MKLQRLLSVATATLMVATATLSVNVLTLTFVTATLSVNILILTFVTATVMIMLTLTVVAKDYNVDRQGCNCNAYF